MGVYGYTLRRFDMDLNAFLNNPSNLAKMAQMLNSPEGQRLRETLKNTDKSRIQGVLRDMGITSSTSPETLKKLSEDPMIIAKINEMLKR